MNNWRVEEPVEVNRQSAERFLWALFNLGRRGKSLSPDNLAADFGSEGVRTIAISGIHALYKTLTETQHPRVLTFFNQWRILFGEVCGYKIDDPSDKVKKLGVFYQIDDQQLKPAELLFAMHTYYALFMKLLAAEIVAFYHKLPTPLQKMIAATTSTRLKQDSNERWKTLRRAVFFDTSILLIFWNEISLHGTTLSGLSGLKRSYAK
jgi:hypothetical protein